MQTPVRLARSSAKIGAIALLLVAVSGCRARFVQATVTNDSGQTLHVVEVDYPGASFGCSILAPHASYSYRFKAIGSGALGLSYSDAAGVTHTSAGPIVADGQAGSVTVRIAEHGQVNWEKAMAAQ